MQRTCILGATQRAPSRPPNSNFGESSAVRMFPLITGINLNNLSHFLIWCGRKKSRLSGSSLPSLTGSFRAGTRYIHSLYRAPCSLGLDHPPPPNLPRPILASIELRRVRILNEYVFPSSRLNDLPDKPGCPPWPLSLQVQGLIHCIASISSFRELRCEVYTHSILFTLHPPTRASFR
jgi:hypothetical protein